MTQQTYAASSSRRIAAQARYEFVTMLRNGEQLMLNIAFPVMGLLALKYTGFIDGYAASIGTTRMNAAVPGVLALCVLSTALSGQGIATGFDRRYGVLRFLSTTPLGKSGLIAGKIAAVLGVIAIQFLVVGSLGFALGWRPSLTGLVMALPTVILGTAAFTALGLLIAGTVRAEATLAIVNMAWVILAAVGGTLIPGSRLPGVFSTVVGLLPSGALGNALRAEMLHHQFLIAPHLIIVAWAALCAGLAIKYFKWSA